MSDQLAAVGGPVRTSQSLREDSVAAPVPWHYGDPHGEQVLLESGRGSVDLSHRDVIAVSGAQRLRWLHDLTTAHLRDLQPGESRLALVLDPHGHVEHELHVVETGERTLISVEPGAGPALAAYLVSMRFMLDVEVEEVAELAVVWEPVAEVDPLWPTWLVPAEFAGTGTTPSGASPKHPASKYVPARPAAFPGREILMPRGEVLHRLGSRGRAGTWALTALRVAAAVPRFGFETDHRTLPHEVGWIGSAVHLAKGCYRGQETVARVHNVGRPPRRLALAHLDGSENLLPEHGDAVEVGQKKVGWVGSVARHHVLGPIATVVLSRGTDPDAQLLVHTAGGLVAASQQVVVTQ